MQPLPGGHPNLAQTEKKDTQAQLKRRADTGGVNSPRDGLGEEKEKAHLKSLDASGLAPEQLSPCRGTVDDDCDYASRLDLPSMPKVKQSLASFEDVQR